MSTQTGVELPAAAGRRLALLALRPLSARVRPIGVIPRGRQDESARVTARRLMMSGPMIVSDPRVMMGKPVVAGTRVTVDLILEKLGSGESIERCSSPTPA